VATDVLEQVALQVGQLIGQAVAAYFAETVAPALRQKMGTTTERLRSAIRRTDIRASNQLAVSPDVPSDLSKDAGQSVMAPMFSMTSTEYCEAVMAALAADAYAAWLREMPSNARIDDGGLPPDISSAIQLVLEGKSSSLDQDELAAIVKHLDGSQAENAPSRSKVSREAIRLPPG